eukprot:Gregarina_sp_Poly_1__435@NODE_1105_length_5086_cov_338_687587_g766_i0_p3_GENE_NODE_1105_length_5086_cov_338_687587_g766_i0NODE_1105_length_5086_cov_338_687587_g766_i0_p3_ORF_typecomplete_len211_score46_05_NODE_1105_length_5086_cov_338_687587_g766_i037734405
MIFDASPCLETEVIRRKRADSVFVRAANLTLSLSLDDTQSSTETLHTLQSALIDQPRVPRLSNTVGSIEEFHMQFRRSKARKPSPSRPLSPFIPRRSPRVHTPPSPPFKRSTGSPPQDPSSPLEGPSPSPNVAYRRLTLFGLEPPLLPCEKADKRSNFTPPSPSRQPSPPHQSSPLMDGGRESPNVWHSATPRLGSTSPSPQCRPSKKKK